MLHAVIDGPGGETVLQGQPGDSVMQLARTAGLPVLGECNGSLACATCHMVVDPAWTGRLPPVSDEEEAMLDTVFDLSPTSRLSCQLRLSETLDGLRARLP